MKRKLTVRATDALKQRIVVGLDIDGTITRHPAFFAAMSAAMRAAGHRVVVITLREDRTAALDDLCGWGVQFDELVTADTQAMMKHGDGWKGVVCAERGVDVLFDDMPEVCAAVGAGTVCFSPVGEE